MTYKINFNKTEDGVFNAKVEFFKNEDKVFEGTTNIACNAQDLAQEYIEKVFIPDLRINFPKILGSLILPWD